MKLYKVNLDIRAYIFAEDRDRANDKIGEYLKGFIKESEDFSFDDVLIDEVEED